MSELSRNTDPESSHAAETYMRKSGKLAANRILTLQLLRANEEADELDATTWELAKGDLHQHERISRRVNDLQHMGLVCVSDIRRCDVTGRKMQAWRTTEAGRAQAAA